MPLMKSEIDPDVYPHFTHFNCLRPQKGEKFHVQIAVYRFAFKQIACAKNLQF